MPLLTEIDRAVETSMVGRCSVGSLVSTCSGSVTRAMGLESVSGGSGVGLEDSGVGDVISSICSSGGLNGGTVVQDDSDGCFSFASFAGGGGGASSFVLIVKFGRLL